MGHGVRDEFDGTCIHFVTTGYLVRLVAHHPGELSHLCVVMLCDVMLSYVILSKVIFNLVMLCCVIFCHVMSCHILSYNIAHIIS